MRIFNLSVMTIGEVGFSFGAGSVDLVSGDTALVSEPLLSLLLLWVETPAAGLTKRGIGNDEGEGAAGKSVADGMTVGNGGTSGVTGIGATSPVAESLSLFSNEDANKSPSSS